MKYLCLVYNREAAVDALTDDEYDTIVQDTLAYREQLRQARRYIDSSPLQSVRTAKTLRIREGKPMVTEARSPRPRSSWAGFA